MSFAPGSPRLPSPPPVAEIPKSPSGGAAATLHMSQAEQSLLDANSRRRIHPGTKAADMAAGPPLVALNELDSAFQLQEHLAALHHHHTESNTKPIDRDSAIQLAQPPPGIDKTLWLYELCRFLISQCNSLIVGFLFDSPPCSASTCPEMRASEWQFLCAVHEQPKSCCAIDYCCHTLDWAANVVTDQKLFPSRFVALTDAHSKNVGVKNLVNVFRRLHRIFAHAWFQHRSVFWSVEGQTGLYVLFKTVCDLYDLLPAENYKLPPEAEGLEAPQAEPEPEKSTPTIMKPPQQQQQQSEREHGPSEGSDGAHSFGRTNTRRHIRSSPSTGSAVTTVMESAEEEDTDGISRKVRDLHISAPDTLSEEPETADVPMMVEDAGSPRTAAMKEAMLDDGQAADDDGDAASEADQTVVDTGVEEQEDAKDEEASEKEQEAVKDGKTEDGEPEQSQEQPETTGAAAPSEEKSADDEADAKSTDESKKE
ncbi:Mob1/phocein [Emericellopsis atlantica]|uniref:Mob1/phocein n=1 Tax=Emericellopsis atlantica TaxID=2614577 RepID=A0A9P8CUM7_9HYPO|nr:Mob1/phocein [Emericellopsis atlantica]KAG9259272.1 Mob1/phocein [Emericellopsis atlantica]